MTDDLQAILHASLDRASLSVEKFSRWLRAICTILLSRNSSADRAKALRYVEQAVAVLEEHTDDLHDENVSTPFASIERTEDGASRFIQWMSGNGS